MIVGVGVDIVDVARFEEACARTPGFLARVLTDAEHVGLSRNSQAARFAAKEAVAKALGAPGGLAWHDCIIRTLASGQPVVELRGTVLARAAELGISSWSLSLSHDGGNAIAFVIASSDGLVPARSVAVVAGSAASPSRGQVRVLGVDACRKGWVAVTDEAPPRIYVAETLPGVVAAAEAEGPLAVIGVDIPIGLPDDCVRSADTLARRVLGARGVTVFNTPVRAAAAAPTYAQARELNLAATGKSLSAQSYGFAQKVLEADEWIRSSNRRVVEVHPELSFARLAGSPLSEPKKTTEGHHDRVQLLAQAGITLPSPLPRGLGAAPDDFVDAAVVAWTARRVLDGTATRLPETPEVFSDGLDAAIWS